MNTPKTTPLAAVDQPRLVRLLPCPFCGSEAEITDESQPDRPQSWFFAWCKNRTGCNSWLADKSPEAASDKWNRRSRTEINNLKLRLITVVDGLQESQDIHGKYKDGATDDVNRMCHAGAEDAYRRAKRLVREAIWSDDEISLPNVNILPPAATNQDHE